MYTYCQILLASLAALIVFMVADSLITRWMNNYYRLRVHATRFAISSRSIPPLSANDLDFLQSAVAEL